MEPGTESEATQLPREPRSKAKGRPCAAAGRKESVAVPASPAER